LRDVEVIDRVPSGDELDLVVGQPERVGQVLINLLLNAGQAMSERPTRRVVLERRATEGGVQLSVADSGPGIPVRHRETIFDPFFTTQAPGEGTGLGLAVSKAMMEAMGGSLDIAPEGGAGATFVLMLPSDRGEVLAASS
ncbi:MAG: ATP-binding protein, partial [Myxococcota bacterium]